MKTIFESAIRKGGFDLSAMLERIDEYHISGKLTAKERDELTTLARSAADAGAGMDIPGQIQQLWAAVRALEADKAQGNDAVADFRQPTGAHDAYYTGDRVIFNGRAYTCVAPAGTACVWSPEVMPDWWQAA